MLQRRDRTTLRKKVDIIGEEEDDEKKEKRKRKTKGKIQEKTEKVNLHVTRSPVPSKLLPDPSQSNQTRSTKHRPLFTVCH